VLFNLFHRRRRLRNIVLNFRVQLKHWLYFFSLSMAVMSTVVLWGLYSFVQFLQSPSFASISGMDFEIRASVVSMANEILKVTAIIFAMYGLLSLLMSLIMTHRIFGPIVPIKRFINDLKAGNYDASLTLRKHDEMKDVAEELKSLAAVLKQKYGSNK
jgi:HAMP domain-containing protein